MAPAADWRPLAPEEAIAFFRAKGYFLTPSFHWQDLDAEAHAAAFTVAKSHGFDILDDIYKAVDEAISEGRTLDQFAKSLTPVLQEKGWWGKKLLTDPLTTETAPAQLGSPRRLRIIFDTNLRMAYAAGRWQRIARVKHLRPYLRYVAVLDDRTRPQHRAWHDTVRPVDDDFWQTHFPPNGWQCRCSVQQLSERDLARLKLKVSPPPPTPTRSFVNKRSGEVIRVPRGIDPGFGQNVGRLSLRAHAGKLLADGLAGLEAEVAARAHAAAATFALPDILREYQSWIVAQLDAKAAGQHKADGSSRIIGALSPAVLAGLERRGLRPGTGAISISSRVVLHLIQDAKTGDGKAIGAAELLRLPEIIARPLAVLRDKRDGRLLYVFDPVADDGRDGKLIVAIDYRDRLPPPNPERSWGTLNQVRSAGLVARRTLADRSTYDLLAGEI